MKKPTIQENLIENYDKLDLEPLPTEIRKGGYTYKLIERTPAKCIYAQCNGDLVVAYEVFKTKIATNREAAIMFAKRSGKVINPLDYKEYKESFPTDEEFGTRAHTYPTLDMAQQHYSGL